MKAPSEKGTGGWELAGNLLIRVNSSRRFTGKDQGNARRVKAD